MASEQEQREKSTEFLLEKMTQKIRDETCETKIEEHLKVSELLFTYELIDQKCAIQIKVKYIFRKHDKFCTLVTKVWRVTVVRKWL